jgi:T-complex protein 1 subunit beta
VWSLIIYYQVSDPNNVRITITNDGATILRSVPVENPAAKVCNFFNQWTSIVTIGYNFLQVLVDIARIQDETVGDGTTSVTVLCGELLREAEQLVNQRIHPSTIIAGWRKAAQIARNALESIAENHHDDPTLFREDLLNIAKTTLSSKLLNVEKDHFATLAVEAVLRLKGSGNLDYIQVSHSHSKSFRKAH